MDELHPLKNAVKAMTGGQPIPITKDPFKLAWLARGSTGKAEAFLKYAVLDGDFKKVGPSLQQVLKPVEKRLDEFRAYAIAKRALELEARNIETGIDPKDATEVVNQFGKDFDPVFRKLVEFQDQVLEQTLVASGIITPEQAALMRQMNQDYVPFYRLFDEKLGATVGFRDSKGYANLSNPIKRLKGSARDIVDPLESIVKNTYAMVNLASRNEVGKALVELAEAKTGAGKWAEKIPTPKFGTKFKLSEIQNQLEAIGVDTTGIDLSKSLATIFRPTNLPPGKENVVTVFRNGEREYWQLEPELYRAMLSMDKESMGILVRILSVPANILRAGATLAPEFVIKNPTKDQLDAYLYSKFGYKPGVDFVRGLFHAVKKDDLFWKWQASGGAQASIVSMDRDYMQNTLVGLLASGAKKVGYQMSHPIELLRSLVEWNETGTRLGEFKRGVKANPTTEGILEAALASRDLIDFSRKGAATAEARRTVPFFNAAIQGTDKMIRAMRDNPKQFTIRALTAITLPTLIFYAMCRKNRKYDELSLKEKDLYWHLPVGPSPEADLLRIPKPHEPGILFGSTIERAMRYIDTQDPKAFDELGERLITEALPSFWPQFIAPYLEAKQNERIYSGVPIVPQREQDLPPEMQYGPYTSDTAKWLGEKIRQSPRIIEHYVNAYGGGLARLGLEGADFVTRLLTGEEEVPRAGRGLADVPGLRAFATTPYQNPQSVSEFYDELERLRKEEQRVKAKGDRMKPDDGVLLRRLEMASKTLAEIHKRQRAIEASTTMTAERKRTELDKLTEYEIRVARQALGKEPLGSK
ncbi:MAG: LPD38 domain-containing protein [Acetivibrionales bacterium]